MVTSAVCSPLVCRDAVNYRDTASERRHSSCHRANLLLLLRRGPVGLDLSWVEMKSAINQRNLLLLLVKPVNVYADPSICPRWWTVSDRPSMDRRFGLVGKEEESLAIVGEDKNIYYFKCLYFVFTTKEEGKEDSLDYGLNLVFITPHCEWGKTEYSPTYHW